MIGSSTCPLLTFAGASDAMVMHVLWNSLPALGVPTWLDSLACYTNKDLHAHLLLHILSKRTVISPELAAQLSKRSQASTESPVDKPGYFGINKMIRLLQLTPDLISIGPEQAASLTTCQMPLESFACQCT